MARLAPHNGEASGVTLVLSVFSDGVRVHSFYGLGLESSLPLSFAPFSDNSFSDEDNPQRRVAITCGDVPGELPDTVWSSPFVSVGSDGTVLIQTEAVGRFLVERGQSITIRPRRGVAPVEIEAFLMGPVAGVLLHQRGILPLHGSCVEADGCAIVLAGSVGSGKSTVAAALLRKGASLMSDDICPVEFRGDSAPDAAVMAIPGSVGLRLWPDAKEVFEGAGVGWSPIRPGHAKQVSPVNGAKALKLRRLAAVVRLVSCKDSEPAIRRLHGPNSVMPLKEIIYRIQLGRALGQGEALFRGAMRLAGLVSFFELRVPQGLARLEDTADLVLNAVRACN